MVLEMQRRIRDNRAGIVNDRARIVNCNTMFYQVASCCYNVVE